MLDIKKIQEYIPHRYPFLLVDRIIEMSEEKVVGIKNVTINEPFFSGHFPGQPIMPGVLIIESMAQVACTLAIKLTKKGNAGKVVYFMGIEGAKFRKPVVPGDQLRLELMPVRRRSRVFHFQGQAFVDGKLVCEAKIKAMMGD